MMNRYQVDTDGLTLRPRFSRRYAVVDIEQLIQLGLDARPKAVLETDDPIRARAYADELNGTA